MTTHIWEGDSVAIAHVQGATISDVSGTPADTTYNLTINDKSVSVVGDTDTATTAAAMVTAWNNSAIPEFAEITASLSGSTILMTHDIAGVPFVVTSSDDGGTGTITSPSDVTASSGPNHWDTAGNWDANAVPGPGDDDNVILEGSGVSILYGLDSNVSDTLTALTARKSFSGSVGLPRTNANGYVEYRTRDLKHKVLAVDIGEGNGTGTARFNFDALAVATVFNVHNTASSAGRASGTPAVKFKGSAAANVVNVTKGSVGIGFDGDDTSTVVNALTVGRKNNTGTDAVVTCGSGSAAMLNTGASTIKQNGGTLSVQTPIDTLTQFSGTTTIKGDAAVDTLLDIYGTVFYESSGTCAACSVRGGVLDFRGNMAPRTFGGSVAIFKGGAIHDPAKTVTWSSDILVTGASLLDVTLDIGPDITVVAS